MCSLWSQTTVLDYASMKKDLKSGHCASLWVIIREIFRVLCVASASTQARAAAKAKNLRLWQAGSSSSSRPCPRLRPRGPGRARGPGLPGLAAAPQLGFAPASSRRAGKLPAHSNESDCSGSALARRRARAS